MSRGGLWTAAFLAAAMGSGCSPEGRPQDSPSPRPAPSVARIGSLTGRVRVMARGTVDWVKATEGLPLRAGDQVTTDRGAGAKIEFLDGTLLDVRPDSLVTIEGIADLSLKKGQGIVRSQQKNLERPPEVSTPTSEWTDSRATSEPPTVSVQVKPTGEGRIDQLRGMGRVTTVKGETVDLGPNTGVVVDPGGSAGPRRALPRIPALLSPPHQADLAHPDPATASTVLAWEAVPGAVAYHLQLDDDGWFTDPLEDRRGIRGSSLTLPGLAEGKYYWRVSAVDAQASEGSFSEFARFSVRAAAGGPPPALVVESLVVRRNILHIKGRTEAGALVTVNGQHVDVQQDGSFAEFITLPGAGEQKVRIRVKGASGTVLEQERTVAVNPF